jgi:predicted ATP-grasp superfamily ATP-dependent carboligase
MMAVGDTGTPVTILGAAGHGPLGIARSLGRLGVPVYAVDARPRVPVFRSRYCRGRFVYDVEAGPPEAVVGALGEVARAIGRRSLLLPTTDAGALFVATHAAALREAFVLVEVAPALVRGLCSKREMDALARRCGVATAQTEFPQTRAEVEAFCARATFPVMLKGIDGVRLQRRCGERMFIVREPAELLARYEALEDREAPNLMLQEYIPGGDDTVWMFNGYFDARSECLFGITGKKLRQHPVGRGSTSLGVCLPNPAVEATTRTFMKTLGYRGILDIGYRYDARDGRYKVLDVNPRIGATFRLFVADNGLDVARALYLDATGQPVPPGRAVVGRKWIVEDFDLISCLRYRRAGVLTVSDWMQSLRGVAEVAYLSADDPLPVLAMCTGDARALGRRLAGRARRHVPRRQRAAATRAPVEATAGPLASGSGVRP